MAAPSAVDSATDTVTIDEYVTVQRCKNIKIGLIVRTVEQLLAQRYRMSKFLASEGVRATTHCIATPNTKRLLSMTVRRTIIIGIVGFFKVIEYFAAM